MAEATRPDHVGTVRQLLLAAFTAKSLRRFCDDRPAFRSIVSEIAPGDGLADVVDKVIEHCKTRVLLAELLAEVARVNPPQYARFAPELGILGVDLPPLRQVQPSRHGDRPAKIFLCYKRKTQPDHRLADYLYQFLSTEGHDVFIDRAMHAGTEWQLEIDRQIKASDFLVVLLSEASAHSEMVRAEVQRAYDYREQQGHPQTLPVRVAYEEMLPYTIFPFLGSFQYVAWESEADHERVGHEILAVLEDRSLEPAPAKVKSAGHEIVISEDGHQVGDEEVLYAPLPVFDFRLLEELEDPSGPVRWRSKFYVKRKADTDLKYQLARRGSTTLICAPNQSGKSSLLIQGVHHARKRGLRVVALDLQRVASAHLTSVDGFLRYLADFVVGKLRLDPAEVGRVWQTAPGPQEGMTSLMEDYILPHSEAPLVLAIDETDRLLQTAYYSDFFALLRFWHGNRAMEDQWNDLHMVMTLVAEPYLLIVGEGQSPWNVGRTLHLRDFDLRQVRELNRHHGSQLAEGELQELHALLDGHPYLTRKALYDLAMEGLVWADLARLAADDRGPFGEHLQSQYWSISDQPGLRAALRQIILHNRCEDESAFLQLQRYGLVKENDRQCVCRCRLYEVYFRDKVR